MIMIIYREHSPSEGHWVITAHAEDGRQVGFLEWDLGEIDQIEVHPDWQRRGIATAMWRRAQQIEPGISHSPARTRSGDAWAQSLGDPLPERENERLPNGDPFPDD